MSRGLDAAKLELWQRRLREFERGTETVATFCRRVGVSATFYFWRRRVALLAQETSGPKAAGSGTLVPPMSFLPVQITGQSREVIEVLLTNGTRVLVPRGDREGLRVVLEVAAGGTEASMLSLPPGIAVFMAIAPVDCRKSFDGLTAAVETVFERNVLDGHLFLFLNRKRDRVKILWWDRDGKAIFAKRLERGSYELPRHEPGAKQLQLDATQLALLLGGVQLDAPKRKRYVLPQIKAG